MAMTTIQRMSNSVVACVAIVAGMVLATAANRHHDSGAGERQKLCE